MVRAFAASAIRLRQFTRQRQESAQGSSPFRFIPRDDVLLDKVAPVLVVMFLAIAAAAMAVQFTSSRETALKASEASLAVAAHLVARDVTGAIEKGHEIGAVIRNLPAEALDVGRRFIVVDQHDHIRTGLGLGDLFGMHARLLVTTSDFDAMRNRPGMQRVTLADGRAASLISLPLPMPYAALFALQPVDDELAGWREHAFIILSMLLAFGAVTIAFALAYSAQRNRARDFGNTASLLQSRFESALDRGRCGLWDYRSGATHVAWSASMWRLLGMEGDDDRIAIGDIEALLHPDDQSPFELLQAALSGHASEFDHLFRMRHAVGEYVWLRMRAVLTNDRRQNGATLLGFVMDVTTERAVEQESHRADLRLRDAIESISEAFVLWDEHNQLVMCNTKYQSFHGLPTELVQRGTAYRDLMAVARAPQMEIEIPHGLDEETGERSYEAQFQDGRWLQISERHTRHGGFVSVGTDITSRKAQEEQLLENERRLRLTVNDLGVSREALRKQASQLSELADRYLEQKAEAISASRMKAEFLANMNHEMRTPLNAIIGFSEALQQQVWGPIGSERYLGYVNDIHASGARLLVLVNDILDMANIEAGRVSIKREAHSIGDLLAASVRRVIPDAEAKAVSLSIDPDEGSPAGARELLIDPEAMMQALTHLLRNSIRLSPTGGQVSMRARLQGEGMNIFIADAGCTLTATEIGALNDPFGHIDGMLHNGCKGSGLGFPIAKALIELHGGTLKMRSSPRYGSLVMVHLPIAPEPQQLSLPIA